MPQTADEISRAIRARLRILDPDISAEALTPERKIIDTVSEVLAGTDIDKYVIDYQYDVDAKAGADLDKFVALFGFARQAGRRATGTITLSRNVPATADISIPAGTQIIKAATRVAPAIIFQTIVASTLYVGTSSVDIPIECTVAGAVGNVPSGTITTLSGVNTIDLSSVTNPVATTGGSDLESDAELRVRFKNTIFRNITGTRDQYLAIAIASQFANKANVVGAISRYVEYVQIDGTASATSQIPYSQYTYPFDYYLTDGSIINETFFTPRGVDYTFNTTTPPTISVNNSTKIPNTTVLLLEHSYCSINSRNIPSSNIANYVDVFVSGSDETTATETAVFPTSGNNIVGSTGIFFNQNWRRRKTSDFAVVGNRLQELMWQPVDALPDTISIGNRTYYEDIDYWLVKDVTLNKGSRRSRDGIEWAPGASSTIGSGTSFTFTYTFDRLPLALNEVMEAHKAIGTDVLVHSATERYFNINLVVMYSPGYSREAVDQAVAIALTDFLEKQQFGVILQISDILDIAHNVIGVDNVRLANPSDGVAYGVQEVAFNGVTPLGAPYINDFAIQDSDLPVLNKIVTTQRSQNTWS